VDCFLLEGVAFEEAGVLMLFWGCQCCCSQELIAKAGLFLFRISSSILVGCVHPYCHYDTALLQRLNVINIFLILIYILYLKIARICRHSDKTDQDRPVSE
jgi:hypothetical protein